MNIKNACLFCLSIPVLILMYSCRHDDDPKIDSCLPVSLQSNTDSIVFQYNNQKRLTASRFYFSSQYLTGSNEFEYNSKGQLITLKNFEHKIFSNEIFLKATYILEYNDMGLPSVLHTTHQNQINTEIRTEFIHDDEDRLASASIKLVSKKTSYESAGYRYEYDDKDNVVKIFYKVRLNNSQAFTEVLARENSRFDDSPVFYKNSADLRIANIYMYSYVPSNNNCLLAKVYYPDFNSHFVVPEEFEFISSYDQNGLITQLVDPYYRAQLYFNEALFTKVSYDCK
ncbi:MAG TPA: hypothetical protein VIT44_01550 [Cyclobacteriaceae bacterium]